MSAVGVPIPYDKMGVVTVSSNTQYEQKVTIHHVKNDRDRQVLTGSESGMVFPSPNKPSGNSQNYEVYVSAEWRDSDGMWHDHKLKPDKDAKKEGHHAIIEAGDSQTPNSCTITFEIKDT